MQVSQSSKIRLSDLIHQLLLHSYDKFKSLSQKLGSMSDVERKVKLLKFFKTTRIQFVRLLVLVNASREFPLVEKLLKLIENINRQDGSFTETADQLYWLQDIYLHSKMGSERVPIYDIPSAIDILSTGSFRRLPSSIENPKEALSFSLHEKKLSDVEKKEIKSKLEEIMSIKLLLYENVPQHVTCNIEDGKLILEIENEYKAILTYTREINGEFAWEIIEIDIFISPEDGIRYIGTFHLNSIHYEAQELINNSKEPLLTLCNFLDSISQSLQLEILYSQILGYKRSKDTSFVVVKDILFEEGELLKIILWNDSEIREKVTLEISPTSPINRKEYGSSSLTISTTPSLVNPQSNKVHIKVDANDLSIQSLIQSVLTHQCHQCITNLYNDLVDYFRKNTIKVVPNTINFTISHNDIFLIKNEDLSYSAIKVRLFDDRYVSIVIGMNDGRFKIVRLQDDIDIEQKDLDENMGTLGGIINSLLSIQSEIIKNGIFKIIQSLQVPVYDKGYFTDVLDRFGKDTLFVKTSSLDFIQDNLIITFSTKSTKSTESPVYVNMKVYKVSSDRFQMLPIDEILMSLQLKSSNNINDVDEENKKMKRQKLNTEQEEEEYINIDEINSINSKTDLCKLFSRLLLSNKNYYSPLTEKIKTSENIVILNQDFNENKQIYHFKLEYVFKDHKIPFEIKMQNDYWTAILMMGKKVIYAVREVYLENSDYTFDAAENKWFFRYRNYNLSSFENFEKDLMDLIETLYMLYQYEECIKQKGYGEFFNVNYLSFNSLCIKYGDNKDCNVTFIISRSSRDVKVYPKTCFKYLLSQSFNDDKSISKVLEMLWNTSFTENYITKLSERSPHKILNSSPQSLYEMKLKIGPIFFNLRFIGNRTLLMTLETPKPPIDHLFIAVSLEEIKNRAEYSKYSNNFITEPKMHITENLFAFSDVYFPPLFDRIYSKLKSEELKS